MWDRPWDPHSEWGRGNVRADRLKGDLLNDLHLAVCDRVARKSGWVVKSNPYEGGSDHTVFGDAGVPSLLELALHGSVLPLELRHAGQDQRRVTEEFTDYRAPLGHSAGGDVNDPRDDRELRRPDLHSVNLQLRFNMRPILKQQLDFFVDVLNVFALRTATGVTENDGPSFGRPTGSRMGPMRMRLGMNYRY